MESAVFFLQLLWTLFPFFIAFKVTLSKLVCICVCRSSENAFSTFRMWTDHQIGCHYSIGHIPTSTLTSLFFNDFLICIFLSSSQNRFGLLLLSFPAFSYGFVLLSRLNGHDDNNNSNSSDNNNCPIVCLVLISQLIV